jgi:hypothetical protein
VGDEDFTSAGWVYLDSKVGNEYIINRGDDAGIYFDSAADRFRFRVTGGVNANADNLGSPSLGTWYFVVGWHDSVNNQIGIQVNSGTANTTSHSTGVTDNNTVLAIGAYDSVPNHTFNGRIDEVGFWKKVLTAQERTDLYNSGLGNRGITYSVVTAGDQISTTSWSDINDVDVTETLNSQTIYYSVSFDGRTTFSIYDATTSNNGWRPIVRNNASTWQYNSNTTAGVDKVTWTNATYNSQNGALSQAFGVTVNQMSGTTLGALSDLNWNEINGYTSTTNTLDFAAGFKSSVSTQNPQVDGINVKYTKAGYKIVEVDSNTSRLYNYSGATQNLKFGVIPQGGGGSPGAGSGLWTNNNSSVANGSYIEVAHNQITADLITNGWINLNSQWKSIDTATESGVISACFSRRRKLRRSGS